MRLPRRMTWFPSMKSNLGFQTTRNIPYLKPHCPVDKHTLGTFRICYETNAKRKFDSARNRFVENRFQVSQVVMQMCMATTNTAAGAGSLAYGFLHAHVHGSWNQGKNVYLAKHVYLSK